MAIGWQHLFLLLNAVLGLLGLVKELCLPNKNFLKEFYKEFPIAFLYHFFCGVQ